MRDSSKPRNADAAALVADALSSLVTERLIARRQQLEQLLRSHDLNKLPLLAQVQARLLTGQIDAFARTVAFTAGQLFVVR